MDEKNLKFVLIKKLLIFGGQGVGKTTLSSFLQINNFNECTPSKNSKYIFLIFINIQEKLRV